MGHLPHVPPTITSITSAVPTFPMEDLMAYTSKNTAETQDFGVAVDRTAHLDDLTVNFVSIRETHSLKDALSGLPNGQCVCPHWGYVLSGSMTCDFGDREETYGPG